MSLKDLAAISHLQSKDKKAPPLTWKQLFKVMSFWVLSLIITLTVIVCFTWIANP